MRAESIAWWLRIVGLVLVAIGTARVLVAVVTSEPVDESGVVPGAVLGFGLMGAGAYTVLAAGYIGRRMYWGAAIPISLVAVSAIGLGLILGGYWVPRPDDPFAQGLVGAIVLFGIVAGMYGIYLVIVVPAFLGIAWLVDQVPFARERGIGKVIRDAIKPRSWR
jgi:hypothetical protein